VETFWQARFRATEASNRPGIMCKNSASGLKVSQKTNSKSEQRSRKEVWCLMSVSDLEDWAHDVAR